MTQTAETKKTVSDDDWVFWCNYRSRLHDAKKPRMNEDDVRTAWRIIHGPTLLLKDDDDDEFVAHCVKQLNETRDDSSQMARVTFVVAYLQRHRPEADGPSEDTIDLAREEKKQWCTALVREECPLRVPVKWNTIEGDVAGKVLGGFVKASGDLLIVVELNPPRSLDEITSVEFAALASLACQSGRVTNKELVAVVLAPAAESPTTWAVVASERRQPMALWLGINCDTDADFIPDGLLKRLESR